MVKLNLVLSEKQKDAVKSAITRVPRNEEEVKRIFYKLEDILGFQDVKVFVSFPDASAFYRGKEIDIEFEYNSSNFAKHKHEEKKCDLIICWKNDDNSLKTEVLELSTLAEDWLKAREELMMDYARCLLPLSEVSVDDKIRNRKARIESLMEKYNFDGNDATATWMGMTKSGLRYYDSWDDPQCTGGRLECEKRDIEPKYLGIKTSWKLFPVVICKNCKNKTKCRLGNEQKFGYYFLLSFKTERPRKVFIERKEIGSEEILSHTQPAKLNLWKELILRRR